MKRLLLACLFVLSGVASTYATHIVGAELYYVCTDSLTNTYDLTLKMYRDCERGEAPFDNIITLFIFNAQTGAVVQTQNIPVPPTTPQIQPSDWSACVATPPAICVEEGIYQTSITLPPNTGGYHLGWSRCCRNSAISNLSAPLSEGITFLATIPPSADAACNSMPQFDQVPPVFLCVNQPFSFDHSATDSDGDSLAYAITDPYTGINFQGFGTGNPQLGGNNPTVDPFSNPMGPPPYNTVNFQNGFSFTNPFGSGNFNIDPQTGFITATPTQTGIFVFSISVFEYRNGVLLSENRRDFQIHVINCLPQGQPPVISSDLSALSSSNDTIFVTGGQPFCYPVTISDPVPTDQVVAFTVSAAFGNGFFFPPAANFTFSGNNPITGQVCWTPSCTYDGQVIPLIIGANDPNECQNITNVFDTVWVNISSPPNTPPVITPDYSGLTRNVDTLIIRATESFCFDFDIVDPDPADSLIAYTSSPIFNQPNGPSFSVNGSGGNLTGQVCWSPGCDLAGQTFELQFTANDIAPCNTSFPVENTIYVRIINPPNQPPGLTTDLNGNVFSNDTIYVDALDDLCFAFQATDPDAGDQLTLTPLGAIFNGPGAPVVTTNGNNPVQGSVCWTPGCDFENQVVPLVLQVLDQGVCNNVGEAFDTVYVAVAPPPNAPPVITPDLSGTNFSNDSIFVFANDSFCYNFTISDPDPNNVVTGVTVSPLFQAADGPSFSISGNNPAQGQVCWTPGCVYQDQVIPLVISGSDDAGCSSQETVFDTVYIVVATPPNDAPEVVFNTAGLTVDGDTIFVDPEENFCFGVSFLDPNVTQALTAFTQSNIFTQPDGPTFNPSGSNPVQSQICWTPSCDYEGQLIPLVVGATDNGECDNELTVLDTIYIKISEPFTLPPVVEHDLSGLNAVGDTVYIEINQGLCYDFYIADLTPENGVDYAYDFEALTGNSLNQGTISVTIQGDSIFGTVCFDSDCSNGGSLYRSIITGLDKTTCPPFESTRDTVYIKVNTSFQSFAGADTSFCEGSGGVQLNVTPIGGTAPYFFVWYCSDPGGNCGYSSGTSRYSQNPIVNPTDTTTYSVQVTDANGCTSEIDRIEVAVKRQPIVDAGPDVSLCEGGPGITLACEVLNPLQAPGPYVYTWLPPDGLNDPTLRTPRARPDSTTIYTVLVSSANGCTSDNTNLDTLSTIEVAVNPRPRATAGPDEAICLGEEVLLQGFASEAGPAYEYRWTPGTGLNDSTLQAPTASPPFTTTYFLTVWSNGCPSKADSLILTIHPQPTADVGTSYETCADDSVQLNGSASGDSVGIYTYDWSPATGLSDPEAAKPWASPDQTTTYELLATSSFGCESPVYEVTVSVLPTPIADAGADFSFCRGDSVQLNGSFTLAGNPATEPIFTRWTPRSLPDNAFVLDPQVSPGQTTVFTLEVAHNSCATTDEVLVTVTPAPDLRVEADTNRLCEGLATELRAIGGLGNASYDWIPATGLSDPSSANPLAQPTQTTWYHIRLQEGACVAEDSVLITVNPAPLANFFPSIEEGCAELTVGFSPADEGGSALVWNFGDGSPISNEVSPLHTYTEPGAYFVQLTATGAGGCEASFEVGPIVVHARGEADFVSDPPQPGPVMLPDGEVAFSDRSTQALRHYWDFGDGFSATEANPLHSYQTPGEYMVRLTITGAGGCTDEVIYGPYLVQAPSVFIPNVFTPNADGINDEFLVRYEGKDSFRMQIFDRWGRPMFDGNTSSLNSWNGLDPEGQPAKEGVYFYAVKIGDRSYTGDVTLLR